MSVKYETQRITTDNYTHGREGKKPSKIVIHHWGGFGQGFNSVRDWLSINDSANASIHWVVQGRNADASSAPRACSIVPESDTAWHAGNWPVNLESIGIECRPEAYGSDYLAVAEVVEGIWTRHGKLLLSEHNDWTSTSCPGSWDILQIRRLAEGKPRGACTRATWRGVTVCLHMVYKLNLWAAGVGNAIRLTPLAGCGSYQTDTEASANTHAGGGAIDIDTNGYTMAQRDLMERVGRLVGLQIAWERDRVSGLWTWHIHALDPQCPNLSDEARAQCVEFGKGGDGLVGTKPDPGTRSNADRLMRIFNYRATSGTIDTGDNAPTQEETSLVASQADLDQIRQVMREEVARIPSVRVKHPQIDYTANPDAREIPLSEIWWGGNIKAGDGRYAALANQETLKLLAPAVQRIEALLGAPDELANLIADRLEVPAGTTVTRDDLVAALRQVFAEAFVPPAASVQRSIDPLAISAMPEGVASIEE